MRECSPVFLSGPPGWPDDGSLIVNPLGTDTMGGLFLT